MYQAHLFFRPRTEFILLHLLTGFVLAGSIFGQGRNPASITSFGSASSGTQSIPSRDTALLIAAMNSESATRSPLVSNHEASNQDAPNQVASNQEASNRLRVETAALKKIGYPAFLSPHARPIAITGDHVFVCNTPADTVDVISRETREIVYRISVGVDPVSVAVRPDGTELWVSNHVSDTVNVIDLRSGQPTRFAVIATIQDWDPNHESTRFDEPVGIAFASNRKAYVALSSSNQIAVVDVDSRRVTGRLSIPAQDPRDIVVRGNRLYVIPFESNNRTQLSGGDRIDGDLVTFNAWEHSIRVNNVLSLGHVVDIVKNPRVPDRDLFVFDTETDKLVTTVDTLGTLLYGITVDANGDVFIAQTDARNDVNGRSGTRKHGLKELENRAFLNRITQVSFRKDRPQKPRFLDLEPLPPKHPTRDEALATPYAIEVSPDSQTLFLTAASSNRLVSVDVESGEVLDRVAVDAVPRGIALEKGRDGKPGFAWILNAVANTVTVVDISDRAAMKSVSTVTLIDPTDPVFKKGRMAFNNAGASSTGTFSCASCHPDGHTDQLLWVLKTPIVTGGNQIMPRSTMPIRGLQDTAPFHWDGIPGDPYGGNNSAHINESVEPNSDINRPESSTRHLIDAGLASTMLQESDVHVNDEGKSGYLSAAERDQMARFLLHVPYPPAQKRAFDNELSPRARKGFELFHVIGDAGGTPGSNLCGNCHRMPFWVSTNTPGTGMDAPTWRGAYDRFLILPQGRLNIIDFPFYARVAEKGIPERSVWRFSWGGRAAFDPVWNMVLEGSTGHSGSFARQLTLHKGNAKDPVMGKLLTALEQAASENAVVLTADVVLLKDQPGTAFGMQFDGTIYRKTTIVSGVSFSTEETDRSQMTSAGLVKDVREGNLIVTFTARHGENDSTTHFQPALWTLAPIQAQSGRQKFPIVGPSTKTMRLNARHLDPDAAVFLDGRRADATIAAEQGERIAITLKKLPDSGIHFLQVQNPDGMFSNDFIFFVATNAKEARSLRNRIDPGYAQTQLTAAIREGNLKKTRQWLQSGAAINGRDERSGMTPLSEAAFHGRTEVARLLLESGAKVNHGNRDGNTPLILAAFTGREEMCRLLVSNGASIEQKNRRGETAIDVVSSKWNRGLAEFYRRVISDSGLDLNAEEMEQKRKRIAELLKNLQPKNKPPKS